MKASRIQVGYTGGLEDRLSSLGRVLRWIGIAGIAFSVFAAVNYSEKDGTSVLYLAVGIIGFLQAIIADAFCQGFAEVIRLLKKQNGLPYGGEIRLPMPVYPVSCPVCGFEGESLQVLSICPNCEATFDSDSE
jgi:hypothetical protein